jgi:hypothetical protein
MSNLRDRSKGSRAVKEAVPASTEDPNADVHRAYEFGGPVGALAMMVVFPVLMYYLCVLCASKHTALHAEQYSAATSVYGSMTGSFCIHRRSRKRQLGPTRCSQLLPLSVLFVSESEFGRFSDIVLIRLRPRLSAPQPSTWV